MIVRQITFEEALKIAACGDTVGVSIPKTETPKEWGDYEHGSMEDRMAGSLFFEYHMPKDGKEATATPVSAKEAVKLAAAGIPVGVSVAQKADPKEWTDFRASTMEQLFAGCLFFSLNEGDGLIGAMAEADGVAAATSAGAKAADATGTSDGQEGKDSAETDGNKTEDAKESAETESHAGAEGDAELNLPEIPKSALKKIPKSALKQDRQANEDAASGHAEGNGENHSGSKAEASEFKEPADIPNGDKAAGAAGTEKEHPIKNRKAKPATEKKVDLGKVLALRKAGWTRREIAEEMGIKIGSVDWYIKKAMAKYGEPEKTAVKSQLKDKAARNPEEGKVSGLAGVIPPSAIPAVAGISAEN